MHSSTHRGDSGAAVIMDTVSRGIDLFQEHPIRLRHVILLLSQSQNAGSTILAGDVVQRLGESNTIDRVEALLDQLSFHLFHFRKSPALRLLLPKTQSKSNYHRPQARLM